MDNVQALRELLCEIGPAMEEVAQVVERSDVPCWGVAFEDHSVVTLEFDDARNVLVLSAELGRPAPERRAHVYGTLLIANTLYGETGGVVMCLTEPDGQLEQILELPAESLNLSILITVLGNFAAKARIWREVVAAAEPSGTAAHPDDSAADAIRV